MLAHRQRLVTLLFVPLATAAILGLWWSTRPSADSVLPVERDEQATRAAAAPLPAPVLEDLAAREAVAPNPEPEEEAPLPQAAPQPAPAQLPPPVPDRPFRLRVVDAQSLSPLSGVQITDVATGRYLVQSDAQGFASWIVEGGGGLTQLQTPGYGLALIDSTHEGRAEQELFEVHLTQAASLCFEMDPAQIDQLRRGSGRAVVTFASRSLIQPRGTPCALPDFERKAAGDAPGEWPVRLDELPAHVLLEGEVELADQGPQRFSLTLEPGEVRVLPCRDASEGGRLSGHLLDPSGQPLPDRELWLLPCDPSTDEPWRELLPGDRAALTGSCRSDGGGAFVFERVPVGEYWLGPAPADDEVAPFGQRHEQTDEFEQRVDVTGHVGLYLRGRVRSQGKDGELRVFASRPDVVQAVQGRILAEQHFEIGPLLPGTWWVTVTHDFFERSDPLRAEPSRSGDHNIELAFPVTASIAGVVRQEAQTIRAKVDLTTERGSMGTSSNDQGDFRFSGLEPGLSYHVRATTTAGWVAFLPDIQVPPGGERLVELDVQPGARLELELRGEHARLRCRILHRDALFADFTLRRGSPVLQPVPPGEVSIEVYGGDRVWGKETRILIAGERTPVHFDLKSE